MTKKKRELIDILLDNVKPEDWPKRLQYAAQDKNKEIYFYPVIPNSGYVLWTNPHSCLRAEKSSYSADSLCKNWSKTIITRDGFVKRWNDRNTQDDKKPDAEGWIAWSGGEMPVEKGTLVDVEYRNGMINEHVAASGGLPSKGSIPKMAANRWDNRNAGSDIIAYRLHVQQEQKTPQQLALEKFGTDWHENDGKTPPLPEGVKIDIEFKNGTIRTGRDSDDSSFEIPFDGGEGFTVTRWRVHSDDKDSQIDKEAKSLIGAIGKLNGVLPTAQQAFDGFKKAAEAISGADIESIISERGNNYGRFEYGAEIMQQLKLIAHTSQGWERMKPIQREGMDMILHKIGRILNGDPAYVDSWVDIEGYSNLVSSWLKGESK